MDPDLTAKDFAYSIAYGFLLVAAIIVVIGLIGGGVAALNYLTGVI